MSDKAKDRIYEGERAAADFCALCQAIRDADVVALQYLSPQERNILQQGNEALQILYAKMGLIQEATPMDIRVWLFDEVAAAVPKYRDVTIKYLNIGNRIIDMAFAMTEEQ